MPVWLNHLVAQGCHSCLKRGTSDWGRMALTGLLTALQTAVNTLKVASALNNISEMLKVSHRTHMPVPGSWRAVPCLGKQLSK